VFNCSTLSLTPQLSLVMMIVDTPYMQKDWLLRFYQDTGMSGLCGKATYGYLAKMCLFTASLINRLMRKSLSKLLFTLCEQFI